MQINVTGHHVEVTAPLRDYVHSKMEKVVRHCDHLTDARCILTVEKLRHKAEATLYVAGARSTPNSLPAICMPPSMDWSIVWIDASRNTVRN